MSGFQDAYHHDDFTTLSLSSKSGSEEFVAGIQSFTVTPTFEYSDLYTGDSILREATRRNQAEVQVDVSWSLFNVELLKSHLGGSTSGTTISDEGDVALFELEFEADSRSGERTLGPVTIEDMRFDDDPPIWDGAMNEWIEWSGTMLGKNVTGVDTTDNTSA